MSESIELEILEYNYWEHFNYGKSLSLILPIGHSKRIKIETEINNLQIKINKIKTK